MNSSFITYLNHNERLPPQIEEQLNHSVVEFQTWEEDEMIHRIRLIKEWRVEHLELCNCGFS